MDLTKYQDDKYRIEEQLPVKQDGKWIKRIYVYEQGKGHPVDQGVIELTEEEAKALLPVVEEPLKLNLRDLVNSLITEETIHLFNELNSYIQKYPIIAKYTEDGVLTKEEVSKLLILLESHKGSEEVSEGLYNVLKNVLDTQE